MLADIKGIEQCTAVARFVEHDGGPDRWVVNLTSMTKRDPRGSSYGPYIKTIATYAGMTALSRQMAMNHALALNELIVALRALRAQGREDAALAALALP